MVDGKRTSTTKMTSTGCGIMKNEVEKLAPRSDVRVGLPPEPAEGRAERVALLRKGLGPSGGLLEKLKKAQWIDQEMDAIQTELEPPIPDVKILAHEMTHGSQWSKFRAEDVFSVEPLPEVSEKDHIAQTFKALQCLNIAKKEGLEGDWAIEVRALELMDWDDEKLDKYSDKLDEEIEKAEDTLGDRGVSFHETPTRRDIRDANLCVDIAEAEGLDKDELYKEEPWNSPFLERVRELMELPFVDLLRLCAATKKHRGITEEEAQDITGYWGIDEP
jgi:hypothetical protein